jgi:CubicO group peptidase (beta-lactamase class C family)
VQEILDDLAAKHGVVGASFAVQLGDEVTTAATGVLNRRTGQPATPDSVFQIGSITKVWTATLVMQLVDDGLVDLDDPIARHLPGLPDDVTVRELLTHTSGLSGDYFPDTGRGDDCLSRYVEGLLAEPRSTKALTSYCNAGFVVLGRLLEVIRGGTWDAVLRERLLGPLGLEAAGTLPEEALLWGAATGHLPDGSVTPRWGLFRAAGPAGLIHARASDLLAFARLHLNGGVTDSGERVLSAASAAAMQQAQAEVPDRWTLGSSFGLAWLLSDWGRPVLGHDGGTLGQNAFLRVLPGETPVVLALLTNGGDMRELYQDLFDAVLEGRAQMPPRLEPPASPLSVDPAPYAGTYSREGMTYVVEPRDDELVLVARPTGPLAVAMGTDEVEAPLIPFDDDAFLTRLPGVAGWLPAVFVEADGTRFLHLGGRATPSA